MTELPEPPIEACPHCASSIAPRLVQANDLHVYANYRVRYVDWCVVCDFNAGGCGATGGYRPHEIEAIDAWNVREKPSEISDVDSQDEVSLAISSGISLVAAGWKMDAAVKATLARIRPYLATREPVMSPVSLDDLLSCIVGYQEKHHGRMISKGNLKEYLTEKGISYVD